MADLAEPGTATDVIVGGILERVAPELILLVGSRAWGTPREDSDYDVMLVLGAGAVEPARQAAHAALRARAIPADVFALSAVDYARQQHDPGLMAYRAAREGRVLYATGVIPQRTPRPAGVREELPTEGLERWLRRSESDLREAENSLATSTPVWDAICFHSHACVEKLLKAVIVRTGTFPPRTHELEELLGMLPPAIRDLPGIAPACVLLMALWPRSRYPELPEPAPDDARQAIAAARSVRHALLPFLIPSNRGGDPERRADEQR
jgi:HEPN domain-containing protein/predicted nucleotidyltransferase